MDEINTQRKHVPKNLQTIQTLRGIASLLVVLLHCSGNFIESLQQKFLGNAFLFGGSGVDIFFVLSGFIITYTNSKFIGNPGNFFLFIRRRIVRIYPTYWIIITGFLLLQILLPSYYNTPFNFQVANLISTYLLFPEHMMVNGVSWTLSYEIFFYLLFAISFFITSKKHSFYLAMIYGLTIIVIHLADLIPSHTNAWLDLILYPMNIEFLLGIVAAVLIPLVSVKLAKLFIVTGTILFLFSAIFSNHGYYLFENAFNRLILFGIPSFLLITGLVKYELTHPIKLNKNILLLGEASYSLYLIHLPLLVAAFRMLPKINIENVIFIHVIIIIVVVIICSASILFYKFVEKPIIARLNMLRRIKVTNEI